MAQSPLPPDRDVQAHPTGPRARPFGQQPPPRAPPSQGFQHRGGDLGKPDTRSRRCGCFWKRGAVGRERGPGPCSPERFAGLRRGAGSGEVCASPLRPGFLAPRPLHHARTRSAALPSRAGRGVSSRWRPPLQLVSHIRDVSIFTAEARRPPGSCGYVRCLGVCVCVWRGGGRGAGLLCQPRP